jgi:peptide/nickel transport system substrate-binding protein
MKQTTKLRWRRKFRRSQQQVENLTISAERGIEDNFFKRIGRLGDVRRFVFGWILLLVFLGLGVFMQTRALSPYYETRQPVDGGIYTEGIVGSFTTANPLYATSAVDSSVSRLVFSGLMKHNSQNQLVGDLAQDIKSNDRNSIYTVTLRQDARWHDGEPVVPEDIIFTYDVIQDPDAKSPLSATWKNIEVTKKDDRTVEFRLPHSLSSFPNLLTNGIVPAHILKRVPSSQLRNVEFNTTEPVGSGPFVWDSIQISGQTAATREDQIGLSRNPRYHGGAPRIDTFIIKAIRDQQNMISQFKDQQIDAMLGLDKIPSELEGNDAVKEYEAPLNAEVMVFFKNSNDVLKDAKVRQALTRATNQAEIIAGIGYPVIPVQGPLLRDHLGFSQKLTQLSYNEEEANKLLESAGWLRGQDGMRSKKGVPLTFRLYSRNNTEYAYVSQVLQRQWRNVGVDVKVNLQEDTELQPTIALHNYDALLYGITVGNDPDVYAYWHSSQADIRSSSRLNLSEFKSKVADAGLEGGRTRADANLRATKYIPFLKEWRNQAPAVGLYQPRFLYVSRGVVYGFNPTTLNTAIDRYANVQNWQVRTDLVPIQ